MSDSRAKLSSGVVLYRLVEGAVEVLLVHPAGNYNRRAPWGIPKGAPDPNEELEATARRETLEETGSRSWGRS
jgi:predicted NUDIX family NTP pyrophosphohydrolase